MPRYLLLILVLLVAGEPLAAQPQRAATGDTVARTNVRLRASPSPSARVVSSVPQGYPVLLRGCEGGWCEVTYMGVQGYAPAQQLTKARTPPTLSRHAAPRPESSEAADRPVEPVASRDESGDPTPRTEPQQPPRSSTKRAADSGPLRPLCKGALDEAASLFADGAYPDTIGLLSRCADDGTFSYDESASAYRMLALAHIHEGNVYEAEIAVLRLVDLEPDYEPDQRLDPPSYVKLVQNVRYELDLLSPQDFRCDEDIAQAEEVYLHGLYAEVEQGLDACLGQSRLSAPRLVRMHRLLALAHMKRGDLDAARGAISDLLDRVPDYRADPVQDLPALVALVEVAREQRARRRTDRGW